MTDKEVFEYLLSMGSDSKDPRGTVIAGLVHNGEIIAASASSDEGILHAEDLVIKQALQKGFQNFDDAILYTTLEPCNVRTKHREIPDCTTLIIRNGIKKVVFGARDTEQDAVTKDRLNKANVVIAQIVDKKAVQRCVEVFNSTVRDEDVNLKSAADD